MMTVMTANRLYSVDAGGDLVTAMIAASQPEQVTHTTPPTDSKQTMYKILKDQSLLLWCFLSQFLRDGQLDP